MCERWVKEKAAFRAKALEEVREKRGKEWVFGVVFSFAQ